MIRRAAAVSVLCLGAAALSRAADAPVRLDYHEPRATARTAPPRAAPRASDRVETPQDPMLKLRTQLTDQLDVSHQLLARIPGLADFVAATSRFEAIRVGAERAAFERSAEGLERSVREIAEFRRQLSERHGISPSPEEEAAYLRRFHEFLARGPVRHTPQQVRVGGAVLSPGDARIEGVPVPSSPRPRQVAPARPAQPQTPAPARLPEPPRRPPSPRREQPRREEQEDEPAPTRPREVPPPPAQGDPDKFQLPFRDTSKWPRVVSGGEFGASRSNGSRRHAGIDFALPTGTPVVPSRPGRVVMAGWRNGYGNLVIVEHSDGSRTWYAHLSRIDVRSGQRVDRAKLLGAVGSTGHSSGPHLHFEIRDKNGRTFDPAKVLRSNTPKLFRPLLGPRPQRLDAPEDVE